MNKIHILWFKESGKYYIEGNIEVPNKELTTQELKQLIVDKQDELVDRWVDDSFYVVTDMETNEYNKPEVLGFYTYLFLPNAFNGMKKFIEPAESPLPES